MASRGVSEAAEAIRRISRKSARANAPDVQLGIVRNTSPLQVELTHGRYLLDEGDDLLLGQVVRATKLEVGDNLVLVDTPDNDWLAVSVISDEAEVALTGLSEPVDPSDAATKQYVDDNAGGGGGGSGVPVGGTVGQLLFKLSSTDGDVAWASLSATAPITYNNATHVIGVDVASSSDTSASKVVVASDTRLSNARTPSGAAGGDLTGTYPNPILAAGSVTSTTILNGTIVDADINASASIALSKLATDPLARANHTGTQTASTISNFDTQVRTSRLDQMAAPTASVSLNSQKLTSVLDPTSAQDAATKNYVDSLAAGLDVKASARAATTASITLSGTQTVDGVSLTAGDRVLVKNQSSSSANGVYVVAAGSWARAADMDAWSELPGAFLFVEEGTTFADTGWVCTVNSGGTLGTTAVSFSQFSGAGTYSAGSGLTLTGTSFSIGTGQVTGTMILDGTITDVDVASANKDGTAATPSLRTLGTGSTQAAAGNDSRLSDSRTPTGSAGGDLTGTYPNPTLVATGTAGTYTKVTTDSKGRITSGTTLAASDIPTLTLSKISDAGTAAAKNIPATGNASATEVVYGSDTRLTDSRAPSGAAGGDLTGTYPNPTIGSGKVTSTHILDGTIVNADINASAAIALSKLATDPLARANHTGTQTASTISDFDTQVRTSRLDQMAAPTAAVSFNSQRITTLTDPSGAQDAATKNYVDSVANGLDVKASVKAATTANITLSGTQTIDGVALVAGDRVLVKNQTTTSANGIYLVAAGAWTRTTDADAWTELPGAFCFVEQGSTLADTGWVCTVDSGGTLGTTAIAFSQFSGAGTYSAGSGLTLTGTSFSIGTGQVTSTMILDGTITDTDVAAANKDGTAATASLRTLGTGATQAAAGNDSRLSDSRIPTGSAGGDLTGTYPNPTLAATGTAGTYTKVTTDSKGRITSGTTLAASDIPTLTLSKISDAGTAAAKNIPATGNASATEVVYGTDTRLTDSRAPSGAAGGDLTGTYPNPTIGTGKVTSTHILDGTIVNADINASAAIALSKLATDPLARANHTGTQTASTISNFDTQVRTSRLDQMAAPTASVSMNSQKITNLATPTLIGDAATKAYVDGVTGVSTKAFATFMAS